MDFLYVLAGCSIRLLLPASLLLLFYVINKRGNNGNN